jgi:hypothetical protein
MARRAAPALCLVVAAGLSGAVACSRSGSASPAPAPGAPDAANAPDGTPGVPCGDLECRQFDSAREAFEAGLAQAGDPLVLGIGEVHAPKGARVPSAAKRFAAEFLPLLAGRASDLLVELMVPPAGCADAVVAVKHGQEPVTSRQAPTDQDEYVAMGGRARELGLVPDMLRPTCADLDAIQQAGDDLLDVSLTTIARLSGAQALRLAERDARSDADRGKLVVIYGGALHNDLSPPPGSAGWSYAPELDARLAGRYVAFDLVVPEFIGPGENPTALPWWPRYDRARLGQKATLFHTGPQSFAIVFPVSPPPP